MKLTPQEQKIAAMIEPVVAEKGLSLVLVKINGDSGMATLQVLAENPETRNIGVDECARLSREIAAILDVEDPIKGAYRLEVSSPGIDRPLTRERDFVDFKGFEAKVEIFPPIEGQKRFKGVLQGVEGSDIKLETEQGPVALPLAAIQKARLVLTGELIAKTKRTTPTKEETENGTAAGS
jgi:ribosome maturation factor RimP